MKAFTFQFLFLLAIVLNSGALFAAVPPNCPDSSCFETNIVMQQTSGNCTTYTLQVGHDGTCPYDLSHFTVAVPCGQVSNVSNSGGWAIEVGNIDPTTGVKGFKIDNISGFGSSSSPQTFTVTYTVCGGTCGSTGPDSVAYKAANCVWYEVPGGLNVATPMTGAIAATDISCFGGMDGALDLTVTGGQAPYTFHWNNGATTEDLNGLIAGTYNVTVTDGAGDSLLLMAQVNSPVALQVSGTVADATCTANGSVMATVTGGTAPYSFTWAGGDTTASISAPAGSYSLTVTDANACTESAVFQIGTPINMVVSVSLGGTCQNPILEAVVSGGTSPYMYQWGSGDTGATRSYGSSGAYQLQVTDANGCMTALQGNVGAATGLTLTSVTTPPSCSNGTDGKIDLSISGGSGNYTINWNNGNHGTALDSLAPGVYSVTVTDTLLGCTTTENIILYAPPPLFINPVQVLQPGCTDSTGAITVQAFFGTLPYTFSWDNGQTGSSISGLQPGSYEVTVTDAKGCTGTKVFVITSPSLPAVSIGGGTCSTVLIASGSEGMAPYTFLWGDGSTSATLNISQAGMYVVILTDAKGCSATDSLFADPNGALGLSYQVQAPTCAGNTDGSIDLTVTGTATSFIWSNGDTTEDLSGIAPGQYTVTVSNGSGCTESVTVFVPSPPSLYINPLNITNLNCAGDSGRASVAVLFGQPPYTLLWNNGTVGANLSTAVPGTFTVTATDANGCTGQGTFSIGQATGPSVQLAVSGCGGARQVLAFVTGGMAPYSFIWANGQNGSVIPASLGMHTVTVTDAGGCSTTESIQVIADSSAISLQLTVVGLSCAGAGDGSISLAVSGGQAPFAFNWSDGASGTARQQLSAGSYQVSVTDAAGCIATAQAVVSEPAALAITATIQDSQGCAQDGSIAVQVNGGTPPYTFLWHTGAQGASITGLGAGTYSVQVMDAQGCDRTESFVVNGQGTSSAPSAMLAPCSDTVICIGNSVTLPVYFTGTGPFSFSYSDGNSELGITTTDNPYMLQVSPTANTTYVLTGVGGGCAQGTVSGATQVQVSQCNKGKVCQDPCFSTQVMSSQTTGNCRTMTLKVSSDGTCRHALSHFTVAVGCGIVTAASNSKGWPISLNATDPTTGLYGFKVDDINGFGENGQVGSFTVTYEVCSTDSLCQSQLFAGCGPLVAYKASTCVYYDKATTTGPLSPMVALAKAPTLRLYPNPATPTQGMGMELVGIEGSGSGNISLRDYSGTLLLREKVSVTKGRMDRAFDLPDLVPGIYLVTVEYEGKLMSSKLIVR